MKKTRIIGPPGTGKTTYLLGVVKGWVESGVEPPSIGFLSFSKAAIQEARDRVLGSLPESEIPNWRTLHSHAFRCLDETTQRIMGTKDWIDFGRRHGYQFSMLTMWTRAPVEPSNDADALLLGYHYGRSTMTDDWEETAELLGSHDYQHGALAGFVRQLGTYKKEIGKLDFHDLLTDAIQKRAVPTGISRVVLDEAQDLTPLQWEYFRAILDENQPEAVNIACDPQQSIYGFSGCDPALLETFAVDEEVVLRQSHRLPEQLVRFARAVCPQAVQYFGRDDGGAEHLTLKAPWDKVIAGLDGRRTFILARSNWIVSLIAQELASKGIDYSTRMGEDGLAASPRQAIRHLFAATKAVGNYMIPVDLLHDMIETLDARECKMPRGYKAALGIEAAGNPGAPRNLLTEPWFKGIQYALETQPHKLFKRMFRRQIPRLIGLVRKRGPEALMREPTLTVMTIHQSKGKEADRVILIPVLPKRVYESMHGFDEATVKRNREGEARLWYVGATRAREELIVVNPYDRAFAANQEYVLPPKPEPAEEVL